MPVVSGFIVGTLVIIPTQFNISPSVFHSSAVKGEAPRGTAAITVSNQTPTLDVSIQALVEDNPAYTQPKRNTRLTYSNPDNVSAGTKQLASNSFNSHFGVSLSGGASRLSQLLNSGEKNYEQDIRQYSNYDIYMGQKDNGADINIEGFTDLEYKKDASLTITLKTKDGDTINFSLQGYKGYGKSEDSTSSIFKGIKVSFEFEGTLSEKEKKEIEAFTQNIDQLMDQLYSDSNLDLGQLDLGSLTTFSEASLSFKPSPFGEVTDTKLELNYSDNDAQRAINVNFLGHKSQLTIDKSSLALTATEQQRQQSIQDYLSLLDSSAREAHAQDSATNVLKQVFEAGFTNLVEKETDPKDLNEAQQLHNKSLVALPDFDFSFDSKVETPNAENRPLEYEGFALDLSMTTQINQEKDSDKVTAVQTQKFELSAAYYTPLPGLDTVNFDEQNYQYTVLERSSEKVTTVESDKGEVLSAITSEAGESNHLTLEYNMGKLKDEDSDEKKFLEVTDFIEQVKNDDLEQSQELLNSVIIDPYSIKQAEEETTTFSITQ